ncbi:MAG: hypothetical protein HZA50_06800 [Planctomycetes bacterium]|nr:hypothetical protein [Planctomycetota bacterium]
MGLDAVELVIRVEDSFDIKIPDDEASAIVSIGDLYRCILHKLGQSPKTGNLKKRCMTARAFYRLRKGLSRLKHCEGLRIRPDTPLEQVLPAKDRQDIWPGLEKSIGLKLPRLKRPPIIPALMLLLCIAWMVLGTSIFYIKQNKWPSYIGSASTFEVFMTGLLVTALLILVASLVLTRPLAVWIPGCANTGDLAKAILQDNYEKIAQEIFPVKFDSKEMSLKEKEVWMALIEIVADQLGVYAAELKPETEFVKDLNCG